MPLLKQQTAIAQWYDLIKEAEKQTGQEVSEDIEFYLIQMLQHFIDKPDFLSSVIALDYFFAREVIDSSRKNILQDIGDKCLLFSGLFPGQAERRHVPLSYFVGMGEAAYMSVADISRHRKELSVLFRSLSDHFVNLMDVLLCIAEMSNGKNTMNLLQAEELWRHTGSQQALKIIRQHTQGFLIFPEKLPPRE